MSDSIISWVDSRPDLDHLNRYKQQLARGHSFGFRKEDRVLDVGPMCFPFPHASHRLGVDERDDPKDGKPFELADIQKRTRFPDKYFDYVYCSHVLEHLDDPIAAAEEISRIGQRGYLEVPSGFSTMFLCYGDVHPKWFFFADPDGTLVFASWPPCVLEVFRDQKVRGVMDYIVNDYGQTEKLTDRDRVLKKFYYSNADLFDPCQLWYGNIKIRKGGFLQ